MVLWGSPNVCVNFQDKIWQMIKVSWVVYSSWKGDLSFKLLDSCGHLCAFKNEAEAERESDRDSKWHLLYAKEEQ